MFKFHQKLLLIYKIIQRIFIELDSDTIRVFHSRKYPQERKRFLSIEPIAEFLAPPKTKALGITLRDLISKIGKIEILHLIKGEVL